MKLLKLLGAAAVLTAIVPFATASNSLAQGWGPCTPPGTAVGAAGPAMNGGQLMAGVGQCGRIGSWHRAPGYWNGGYGEPGWRAAHDYYGGPYGGPDRYYGGPGYGYERY